MLLNLLLIKDTDSKKKILKHQNNILEYIKSRAGYRVWYFLGTDRIASIPLSIEKRLVIRYQTLIPKGVILSTSVSQ